MNTLNRLCIGTFGGALLLSSSVVANDIDPLRPHWRIGGKLHTALGVGGDNVDSDTGAQLQIGRPVSTRSLVQVEYAVTREELERQNNQDRDRSVRSLGVTYQHWLKREYTWHPYLLAGGGAVRAKGDTQNLSGPAIWYGGGFSSSTRYGDVFGEVRMNHRFYQDRIGNVSPDEGNENLLQFAIGVNFDFARSRPAQPYELEYEGPAAARVPYQPKPQIAPATIASQPPVDWDGTFKVNFETDLARLDMDDVNELERAVAYFKSKQGRNLQIAIEGHADSSGSKRYNKALSRARALSISRYLQQRGIPSSRISIKAYGESKPVTTNKTSTGRAKNRRGETSATP